MDMNRISQVFGRLKSIGNQPNCTALPVHPNEITSIKNGLIRISEDISKEFPFLSSELFTLKDMLFVGYGTINPWVFGRIIEILIILQNGTNTQQSSSWNLIHPSIIKSSKRLWESGCYANAAEDAFIEINARVKHLFSQVKPSEKQPDGSAAMTTVFSNNKPLLEFCDRTSETGQNIQKGFMEMLEGAMLALRNPKAHSNDVVLTAEESMRRLMFASMLMYKIDEAVKYSQITE